MSKKFEIELSEPMSVWLDELCKLTGKSKNQVIERLCRYSAFVMSEQVKVYKKEKQGQETIVWMLAGKALHYMLNSDLKHEQKY